MKKKRILAWLVVLCLLVGMIPQLAMAVGENHVAGDGDVPLKLEFLGVDTNHSGPKAAQAIPAEGLKTNDVIWLGISVEGLTKDKMSALNGYGIFAMTMGVNYDTRYLDAYTDWNYSTNAAITQDRYRAAAFRGSVGQYTVGTGSASAELWGAKDAGGGTLYTIDDSSGYGMNLASNTETSALDADNAKLLKIVINGGSGVWNEDLKLYDSTETGKVWLARFPMKVVDDTANGKAVIELALGGQVFSYTIVESESNTVVSANCGAWTVEESSNNLRKVFDYQGAPVLFPAGVVKINGIEVTVPVASKTVEAPLAGNTATVTPEVKATPDGAVLPAGTTWTISPTTGVSIKADTGVVTINPDVAKGTYTVTAKNGTYTDDDTFTVNKATPVATKLELGRTELADVKIPQAGAAAAEYTVTATVKDQYGATMDGQTVTINTIDGIKYEGGKLKVSDEATTGDKTVTFTVGGTSVTKDCVVKVIKGDGKAIAAGTVTVAQQPTAAGNDGSITGVTSDMEVNTAADFADATKVTTFTGMAAGTYYVRYKETAKYNAGAVTTVTLKAPGQTDAPTNVKIAADNNPIPEGGSATLTATYSGEGTATYTWKKDGNAVAGTGNTLTVNASDLDADGNTYTCEISLKKDGETASSAVASNELKMTVKGKTVVTVAAKTTATQTAGALNIENLVTVSGGTWNQVKDAVTARVYKYTPAVVDDPETEDDETAAAKYELVEGNLTEGTYYVAVDVAAITDKDDYKVDAVTGPTAPEGTTAPAELTGFVTLTVNKRSSGGGGGGSTSLTVRFDVGQNGTASGSVSVRVNKNGKLSSSQLPKVTAKEGYTFVGWSLNGQRVDPTTVTITENVTFTAVYSSGEHKSFMDGYEDGTFRPDDRITRGEATTLIVRQLDDYDDATVYAGTFSDVTGSWYANYVNYASSKELVNGNEDGTFRGENYITRQEFCAIVARYLALENTGAAPFADVANIWGEGYIAQLADKGIIDGYEDGSFRPEGYITRAEVVKVLNAVFDRTPDAESVEANIGNYSVNMPDVPKTHWAYYEILEAVVGHEHADFH